ncbi:uncharacterized protein SPSK_07867 [Sporothrix schenckii 1099-18]|uniref:cellulase n=1 Tax=Sporothrix schenckii 1099-18 TaxID=1397361 RepID=A0A0F2MGA4_SPOSC|nr:uncharacterized protein SPSK_07867 [Sporothrix schenckii 1099-18]KJR88089.1 hypothetical protein SPSK_07867 [Sporothrix schenckii 1099-18]
MRYIRLLLALPCLMSPVMARVDPLNAGRTLTGWDCCKPACAWSNLASQAGASPMSLANGQREDSGCSRTPGNAYLCSDYSPHIVDEKLSYAFAVTNGTADCCKCFELTWKDGPVAGKRVQVQVINSGGDVNTETGRDFVIVTPGGGVGPNGGGCNAQYGANWGRAYGGVTSREDCASLPSSLESGCYWRWNWARGDVNNWNVSYVPITCPDYHTQISGCSAGR